jgi:hypothetical protein
MWYIVIMNTDGAINSQATNNPLQEPQKPSPLAEKKKNYWRLGLFATLLLWFSSVAIVVVYFKNNEGKLAQIEAKPTTSVSTATIVPQYTIYTSTEPTAPLQDGGQNIFVRIEPYRADDENGQAIVTFQITNLNEEVKIDKITYWTDKKGACEAKTSPFSEFIKIPMDDINNYSFFQFSDKDDNTSEIYASSHNPIFQCGTLAE